MRTVFLQANVVGAGVKRAQQEIKGYLYPLSPHDALKHHLTSLKIDLIVLILQKV